MYALFEATRSVDQTWLILMAALIIFGAIAGLAAIAARQDRRDTKRGWCSEKLPPAAYVPDNAGVRISGWVIGLLVLGMAALIYVLAGEVVAGLFRGTVGTLR